MFSSENRQPKQPQCSYDTVQNNIVQSNKKEPWSYTKICRRFAERTSMQGVPYIHASKTLLAKIIWAFIFLAGTGAMIYHLYYLFHLYYQYEIKTSVTLGFNSLPFPAVTFCNVNPMRKSKTYLADTELRELLKNVEPYNVQKLYKNDVIIDLNNEQLNRQKRYIDRLEINRSSTRVEVKDSQHFNEGDWELIGEREETDEIYNHFLALYNSESRSTRLEMGHRIDNMLIKCSFAGRICHADNFTESTDAHFGVCYSLQTSLFRSRRSGPGQGLELILFLENHEYIRGITNSNGAQLSVHDTKSLPESYDDGFAVSSNTETLIGLRLKRINRLGDPYGKCNDVKQFLKKYGVKYSRTVCQKFCEAELVMNSCNCTDGQMEEVNMKIANSREIPSKICNTSTEMVCNVDIRRKYETGVLQCKCENPCEEREYERSISSRHWPSNEHAKLLLEILCERSGRHICKDYEQSDSRALSHNFLKLNIYYEDLNYENITEDAHYENFQFMSDVGGTIGLWLGLSVISVMEVIQFFYELLSFVCCGKKSRILIVADVENQRN